jgi:hypothetical protein
MTQNEPVHPAVLSIWQNIGSTEAYQTKRTAKSGANAQFKRAAREVISQIDDPTTLDAIALQTPEFFSYRRTPGYQVSKSEEEALHVTAGIPDLPPLAKYIVVAAIAKKQGLNVTADNDPTEQVLNPGVDEYVFRVWEEIGKTATYRTWEAAVRQSWERKEDTQTSAIYSPTEREFEEIRGTIQQVVENIPPTNTESLACLMMGDTPYNAFTVEPGTIGEILEPSEREHHIHYICDMVDRLGETISDKVQYLIQRTAKERLETVTGIKIERYGWQHFNSVDDK